MKYTTLGKTGIEVSRICEIVGALARTDSNTI